MDSGNVAHRNFSAERTYFFTIAKSAVVAGVLAIASSSILTGCGGGEADGDGTVYSISGNGPVVSAGTQTAGIIFSSENPVSQIEQTSSALDQSTITVSTSERTAGAISSIQWRGKEFVNNYDHGRQAQYAWQYSYGECANPTEAGSSADGTGRKSSSILKTISVVGNALHTITTPASWLKCGPSVADDLIEKRVTIENGLIKFAAKITARSIAEPIRIEAPTIYLSPEFGHFYTLNGIADHSTCTAAEYNESYWQNMHGCDIDEPIIAATEDGAYAIGIYTVPTGEPITYAFYHLSKQNAEASLVSQTKKIGVYLHRENQGPDGEIITFAAIGSLSTVRATISKLKSNASANGAL